MFSTRSGLTLSTHNDTQVFPSVPAALTSQSLISHAGLNVLTSFLDAVGFANLGEDRLSQFVPAQAIHRPGKILGSLAVMLAGGGEHVSDLDVLRNSPGLFAPRSLPTPPFPGSWSEPPSNPKHSPTAVRRLRGPCARGSGRLPGNGIPRCWPQSWIP